MDKLVFRAWSQLIICVIVFAIIYLIALPWVAGKLPAKLTSKINAQGVDAGALFYTESDNARRAYYYLIVEKDPK